MNITLINKNSNNSNIRNFYFKICKKKIEIILNLKFKRIK